jgi:serine/threonine protein kinase
MERTLEYELKAQVALEERIKREVDLVDLAIMLDSIHRKGIVHRDLKPSNLMLDSKNKLRLADFGLSSRPKSDDVIMGTLNYMSPESVSGELVDGRSDLYSLAIIAAEVLLGDDITGFLNRNLGNNIVRNITSEKDCFNDKFFQRLRNEFEKVCDVDLLEEIFKKATNKQSRKRFTSCAEMMILINCALHSKKVDLNNLIHIRDTRKLYPLTLISNESIGYLQAA